MCESHIRDERQAQYQKEIKAAVDKIYDEARKKDEQVRREIRDRYLREHPDWFEEIDPGVFMWRE